MKTMYLGFSTASAWKPASAAIRWWWGVPYSHVYLRWSTPWGFDEILEAASSHIGMVEQRTWSHKNKMIKEVPFNITHEKWNRVMREIRSRTGTPYGYGQFLQIALCELLKLDKNPWGDGKRTYVCSEVAIDFLTIVGADVSSLDRDRVSPKDIYDFVERLAI